MPGDQLRVVLKRTALFSPFERTAASIASPAVRSSLATLTVSFRKRSQLVKRQICVYEMKRADVGIRPYGMVLGCNLYAHGQNAHFSFAVSAMPKAWLFSFFCRLGVAAARVMEYNNFILLTGEIAAMIYESILDAMGRTPMIHRYQTGLEILEQMGGPIDGFCSGIGTGGTITGIGDGLIPDILNKEIYDDIYIVSDEEALSTARELARKEGLMCGISSGTNVAAAIRLAQKLGPGKTVVTVLPDTAERYFSTPLFED